MVSFLSDSRVMFLLWFVSVSVVVATTLIIIEARLNNKKARDVASRKKKTPIDNMKNVLAGNLDIHKKLEAVDKTARGFFIETYLFSEKLDYGELAKKFKDLGKDLEVEFCEDMFELYYSDKKISNADVIKMGNMLKGFYFSKNVSKDVSVSFSFLGKMDVVIIRIKKNALELLEKYAHIKYEKLERNRRVAEKQEYELLSWVKKAIRMGYDRANIFNLLNDGKRRHGEVKEVLKVYDKESLKAVNKVDILSRSGEGGVAQKIIQKEKNRLEEVGV